MILRNPSRLSCLAAATLTGFGAPALAQEAEQPLCGGVQAAFIGADGASSDVSDADDPLLTSLRAAEGNDALIAFRVGADSESLRIEAQSGGDPALELLTADGDLIAENDDTPESLNSRIETNLGRGDYCVRLISVGGGDIAATVQIGRQDQPRLLNETGRTGQINACDAQTATVPFGGDALDAALADGAVSIGQPGTDTGYYRFALSAAAPVTFRATSPTLDPHVRLFDQGGNLIAENDDADGTDSRLDFPSTLAPGSYCLGVAALSPAEGEITVSAETLDRDAFLQAAYRRGEIPPPADSGYPVQELDLIGTRDMVVLQDGSAQWFRFSVETPSVVIVDAYGALVGGDPKLVLFGAGGQVVAENDDYEGGLDAKLGPVLLEPGSYRMALTDVGRQNQTGAPMRPVGLVFDLFQRVPKPE